MKYFKDKDVLNIINSVDKTQPSAIYEIIVKLSELPGEDVIPVEKDNEKDNITLDFFEKIWAVYPVKKGKASVSLTQKRKLERIGFDLLCKAIDDYRRTVSEAKYLMHGGRFFTKGYIDYIPAESIKAKKTTAIEEKKTKDWSY